MNALRVVLLSKCSSGREMVLAIGDKVSCASAPSARPSGRHGFLRLAWLLTSRWRVDVSPAQQ